MFTICYIWQDGFQKILRYNGTVIVNLSGAENVVLMQD